MTVAKTQSTTDTVKRMLRWLDLVLVELSGAPEEPCPECGGYGGLHFSEFHEDDSV